MDYCKDLLSMTGGLWGVLGNHGLGADVDHEGQRLANVSRAMHNDWSL